MTLEMCRLWRFAGLGGWVWKGMVIHVKAEFSREINRSLAAGAWCGSTWTVDRAYRRGLRQRTGCKRAGPGFVVSPNTVEAPLPLLPPGA